MSYTFTFLLTVTASPKTFVGYDEPQDGESERDALLAAVRGEIDASLDECHATVELVDIFPIVDGGDA